MTRSKDDASTRLQAAALALFVERGYDRTTAAEIAARAGVTERTYFRYFGDKREVMFAGESVLKGALLASIEAAPATLDPFAMLLRAFKSVEPLLEANRSFAYPRHLLIAGTPALYERELAKLASLADALRDALIVRGVDALPATLASQTGLAAFTHATVAWLEDPATRMSTRLDAAVDEMKKLMARVPRRDVRTRKSRTTD